jgi:hypothetical protein
MRSPEELAQLVERAMSFTPLIVPAEWLTDPTRRELLRRSVVEETMRRERRQGSGGRLFGGEQGAER